MVSIVDNYMDLVRADSTTWVAQELVLDRYKVSRANV